MPAEDLRRNLEHSLEEVGQVVVLEDSLQALVDRPKEVRLQRLTLSLGQCLTLTQFILHASHFHKVRHENLCLTLRAQLAVLLDVLGTFVATLTMPVYSLELFQDGSRDIERALSRFLHAADLLRFPLIARLLL